LPELRLLSGRGLRAGRGLTASLPPAAPLAPKVPFFSSSFFLSFFLTIQKSALRQEKQKGKEKRKKEKKGKKRNKSQGERLTHYIFAEGALQSQWTTETHQDKYLFESWDFGLIESEESAKKQQSYQTGRVFPTIVETKSYFKGSENACSSFSFFFFFLFLVLISMVLSPLLSQQPPSYLFSL
jgi:hypothetical protein